MIKESGEIENGAVIKTEICIVGAGPAGITLAREFIQTKHAVTLLESGGMKYDENDEIQELNTGKNEAVNDEITKGIPAYKLEKIRARGFGGSSWLWHVPHPDQVNGLRLRGLDEMDFDKRDWVPNSGWPIKKKDLAPYYERAHKVCKIGPYRYDYGFWKNYTNGAEETIDDEELKTTFYQIGKSKVFFDDYFRELKKAENIDVLVKSTVLRIELSENGSTTHNVVVSNLDGKSFTVKAKYFILALGGLETPRLMLISNDVMNNGVGNQHDLVGRYFMEHPHIRTGMFYPADHTFFERALAYDVHDRNGTALEGSLRLAENIIKKERLLNFCAGLIHIPMVGLEESDHAISQLVSSMEKLNFKKAGTSVSTILNNLELIINVSLRKSLKVDKKKWYDTNYKYHGYRMSFKTEQIPDPESRVVLDTTVDKLGQRKIKLNWKLNSDEICSIKRTQELIDREFRDKNLGRIDVEMTDDIIPESVHGGKHHMGTTRMNKDPRRGVVDENCRVHGIKNLFIAGSSVFPTVGFANPTLTIVALSIRLADYIKSFI